MQRQFDLAPMQQCGVIVAEVEQQAAELVERTRQQLVRRGRLSRQPGANLGDPVAALDHRTVVKAIRSPRQRNQVAGQGKRCVSLQSDCQPGSTWLGRWRRARNEGIYAAAPGPQVGCTARGQRNRFGVEPEHQPRARVGRQALAARIERVPARRVEPARAANHMHHRGRTRILDEARLQRRDVGDLVAQRQAVRRQSCGTKHLVERRHDLPAQGLVGRIDQQPLERRAMHQGARQAQEVVVTMGRQAPGGSQPHLFCVKYRASHGADGGALQPDGAAPGTDAASPAGSVANW